MPDPAQTGGRPGFYSARIFPKLMDRALSREEITSRRSQLLEPVSGHVLEVGFGTGLNLYHYASELTSLTAIDSNPGMLGIARPRARRSHFPVDLRPANVLDLPMDDDTFDAVVSTFTMCSIHPIAQGLAEMYRVLKPGGSLYFLEHGLAQRASSAAWQRRLNPLQRRLAGGCHLDLPIPTLLDAAGFIRQQLRVEELPRTPRIFGTLYTGCVRKPLAHNDSVDAAA